MRIAIIGGGISGLTAAYLLQHHHEIELFEANHVVGGHTNTISVAEGSRELAVDTGFIVFNHRTYPNFTHLLSRLGVAAQETEMSFSVRCDRSGLEWRGADLNGVFAQRKNLLNPRFYRMLLDLVRFNRRAAELLADVEDTLTVGEFFQRHPFSREFLDYYFRPMGSAVWSCPRETLDRFPIRFLVEFYRNHGLLNLRERPQWLVIQGGSREYVKSMIRGFEDRIRTSTPIEAVRRTSAGAAVRHRGGWQEFDHLIFACHSDQALRILGDQATPAEREVLTAFPYERNVAVLHTDVRQLPRSRRAWASWNYRLPVEASTSLGSAAPRESGSGGGAHKATVTYNMNILQRLQCREVYCVTLNPSVPIRPESVIRELVYHHPVFTSHRSAAQRRHGELIGALHTSYCGAYWGNGFHEDGVNSALAVCSHLDSLDGSWKVASMSDTSAISGGSPSRTHSAISST